MRTLNTCIYGLFVASSVSASTDRSQLSFAPKGLRRAPKRADSQSPIPLCAFTHFVLARLQTASLTTAATEQLLFRHLQTSAATAPNMHASQHWAVTASEHQPAQPLMQSVPAPEAAGNICLSLRTSSSAGSDTCSGHHGMATSSSSSQDSRPSAHMRPGPSAASLLCDSLDLSTDSMSSPGVSPAGPGSPAGHSPPPSKRHCQHTQSADGRAGSGMQNQQVDVSCRPGGFTLPSLFSMLGGGGAASKLPSAGTALAAPQGACVSSKLFGSTLQQHCCRGPAGQPTAPMQDSPHPASSRQQQAASPWSTHSGDSDTPARPARTAAHDCTGRQAGVECSSPHELVQAFMQACASPGVLKALAVLAQNNLLPVPLAVLSMGDADESQIGTMPSASDYNAASFGSKLCCTLAYMFVLAARGAVLDQLSDTCMRTLLWMTESLSSQQRSTCRVVAYDYIFYDLGCRSYTRAQDDAYVVATLAEEVPAMIELQAHILDASGWQLLVTPEQLQFACSQLEACGSGSGCSVDAIQVQLEDLARLPRECRLQQQQQQQQATSKHVAGAGDTALVAGAAVKQQLQQRKPLQVISNAPAAQPPAAAPSASHAGAGSRAQQLWEPQASLQQKPQTRLQRRLGRQQTATGPENVGPVAAGPDSDSKRAKDQLLQLASREQALGKRRHSSSNSSSTAALPAAGAAAGGVLKQQQARVGGFGAGGKRALLKVIKTARSAAHYLGCRPQ